MDILNVLPPETYGELDDLLTFISIYDDEARTEAYRTLLQRHADAIQGSVCVDAGCGMGYFSEQLVALGARKVYAVEANTHLHALASQRLQVYPQVECIHMDIQDFQPEEPVNVLVQEFFGQLLYDEDLYALDALCFTPQIVLPSSARLMGGLTFIDHMADETVTPEVIRALSGALVAGLFDEEDCPLTFPVITWEFGHTHHTAVCDLSGHEGDLLYLGLQILDGQEVICEAGMCTNWSYAWTPREGNRFELRFEPAERGTDVFFSWL